MKKIISFLFILGLIITLLACTVNPESIEIQGPNNVYVGKEITLVALVSPEAAKNKDVTWASNDPLIATVNSNGVVLGVARGSAIITATSVKDPSVYKNVTISVDNEPPAISSITAILGGPNVTITKTVQLSVNVSPSTALKEVNWSSSDEQVATISETGVVTGVSLGQTTITASAKSNDTIRRSITITVLPLVESITLNASVNIIEVAKSLQLSVSYNPNNAGNKNVEYASSNEQVATVDESGLVLGVSKGNVTITVNLVDDKTISSSVTLEVVEHIVINVESISVSGTSNITVSGSSQLTVTYNPTNATNKGVDYVSMDDSIASVSTSGVVIGVGVGEVVIKVILKDDETIFDTITINVTPAIVYPTTIEVTREDGEEIDTAYVDTSVQYIATVKPNGANQNVTWHVSDEEIATVDSEGVVTFYYEGELALTIIASAKGVSGNTIQVTIFITVEFALVSEIIVTSEDDVDTIKIGEQLQLYAQILPTYAGMNKVQWVSLSQSIATVNSSGLVTGVSEGVVFISANSLDASGIFVLFQITVEIHYPEEVVCNIDNIYSVERLSTFNIVASVLPTNAPQGLRYTSSNPSVATVSGSGFVNALEVGETTITIESTRDDNIKYEIQLTVFAPDPVEVQLIYPYDVITLSETLTIVANVLPAGATQTIEWASSNTSIAIVSSSGVVTPVARGTTIISATSVKNDVKATLTITVDDMPDVPITSLVVEESASVYSRYEEVDHPTEGTLYYMYNYFSTLKEAVDVATSGMTIVVYPGTYPQAFTISTTNLNIEGPNKNFEFEGPESIALRNTEAIISARITLAANLNGLTINGMAFTLLGQVWATTGSHNINLYSNMIYDTSIVPVPTTAMSSNIEDPAVFHLAQATSSSSNIQGSATITNNIFMNNKALLIGIARTTETAIISIQNNYFFNFENTIVRYSGGWNNGTFNFINNYAENTTVKAKWGIIFRAFSAEAGKKQYINVLNNTFINVSNGSLNTSIALPTAMNDHLLYSSVLYFATFNEEHVEVVVKENLFLECDFAIWLRGSVGPTKYSTWNIDISNNDFIGGATNGKYLIQSNNLVLDLTNYKFNDNYFEDSEGNVIDDVEVIKGMLHWGPKTIRVSSVPNVGP